MPLDLKNIVLQFSGPPDDVLGDYVRTVANGGLGRYRRIIQYGNKQGQPLYAHVIDLVFTFARLAEMLELDETVQRVMMLALSAHDINKVVADERIQLRFADMASQETIAAELLLLGADDFFPAWRSYLADIVALIRAHSDHFHHSGELLLARSIQAQKYALGEQCAATGPLDQGAGCAGLITQSRRAAAQGDFPEPPQRLQRSPVRICLPCCGRTARHTYQRHP